MVTHEGCVQCTKSLGTTTLLLPSAVKRSSCITRSRIGQLADLRCCTGPSDRDLILLPVGRFSSVAGVCLVGRLAGSVAVLLRCKYENPCQAFKVGFPQPTSGGVLAGKEMGRCGIQSSSPKEERPTLPLYETIVSHRSSLSIISNEAMQVPAGRYRDELLTIRGSGQTHDSFQLPQNIHIGPGDWLIGLTLHHPLVRFIL